MRHRVWMYGMRARGFSQVVSRYIWMEIVEK